MEFGVKKKATTKMRRFVDRVLAFPYIGIIWAICTFGYRFPRQRKGENLVFCMFKALVVLVVRFSCIMGAIWYINQLCQYLAQGITRPFNVLETQIAQPYGTLVPILNLFSTETGKISIDGVFYSNKNTTISIEYSIVNDTTSNDPGEEMLSIYPNNITTMGTGLDLESIQIMIKHLTPLPWFRWTVAGLLHPEKRVGVNQTLVFSTQDEYNEYFFRPGHFVEIRYTPMHIYSVYTPEPGASLLKKFKAFMGYGGQMEDYSYQSTADHLPFPDGEYDNLTTVIVIRPQANVEIVSYAEEKVSFRDTMSKIGGLIGIVGSVIVFLFGASLLSPWGFVAGLPFFRRRISSSMAKAYDTPDGLSTGPFTTHFGETGRFDPMIQTPEQKMTFLKERMDELEMVLSEYYLNGAVFRNYAEERSKLRAGSVALMATGKASLDSYMEQQPPQEQQQQQQQQQSFTQYRTQPREPLVLPSQTLLESQHQHRGQLPSPQHPPSYAKQSFDQSRRHSPEQSVLAYYQQQLLQQQRKESSNSEQSLLGAMREEEEDEAVSPTRIADRDHQTHGLLQQDHHSMHQLFLQQQQHRQSQEQQQYQRPPSFPPRPPKDTIIPMTLNTTPGTSLMSPSPPSSHNAPISPRVHDNARLSWQNPDSGIGSTKPAVVAATRPVVGSLALPGTGVGTGERETHYEHLDMSDLSRMPRER